LLHLLILLCLFGTLLLMVMIVIRRCGMNERSEMYTLLKMTTSEALRQSIDLKDPKGLLF
jgi:hypothetical protein